MSSAKPSRKRRLDDVAIAMPAPFVEPCNLGHVACRSIETEPPAKAIAHRAFVLVAATLASSMAFIDGSALSVVVPVLQSDLSADLATVQWLVNAYVLVLASLALTGGALADAIGKARILVVGCAVFGAASGICALAPSVGWLLLGRIAQGVGAAMILPASLALIGATFFGSERYRALSIWAASSALTSAIAPVFGGVLADRFGWRAIFWLNPPLALAAIAILIPVTRADRSAHRQLDLFGAALLTASLGLIIWSISSVQLSGSESTAASFTGFAQAAFIAPLGAAGLVLYGYWERKTAHPMTPPHLIANSFFVGLNLATFMIYASLSIMFFLLPFELRDRRAMSLTDIGLVFLPFTLGIGLLSRAFGSLVGKFKARDLLICGSIGAASAYLWLLAGESASVTLGLVLPMALLGLSFAVLVVPLSGLVMSSVKDSDGGLASGINNAASRIAQLIGVVAASRFVSLASGYEIGLGLSAAASFAAALIIVAMVPGTPSPGASLTRH
jgi:MFS family permease